MWPSAQLKLLAQWLRDRSSVSIFDAVSAFADVIKFVNDQFRDASNPTEFLSAPARTLTVTQLADALDVAADRGDAAGILPFVAPSAAASPTTALDWKSI